MIASTPRSSPAFAIGSVSPAFICIGCGAETATMHFLLPRGLCPECCSEHNFEYDRYERQAVCTECDERAPRDWYYVDEG